jgi:hypothetical protein
MARVTRSLRFAAAATALVAAGSSTALGQPRAAQTQEPSRASAPSADEATPGDRQREPRDVTISSRSLFDGRPTGDTNPTSVVAPWLSGVTTTCIGCRGFETAGVPPSSANSNAPWAFQGRWRRQTAFGVVSAGVVGVRNYALPLSTAVAPDGDLDRVALGTSGASGFAPGSQWAVTAGVEKTLAKRANGATVGVAADLSIPVKTDTVGVDDPRTRNLASPTMRVGIVLRW